ncbi:uncharacterized protein J4E78_002566 [Alternaria triticimaculans]|uniref:uncharacterized protein n=1 Tax=Alternaria triticimaculans TaxID=297637 RepID=UPI0020C46525|nr:uncharacterized protein J4E78_002566 [Alternaria triticimaculans]KAI4668738.1 hypothetical protein J4E78_002566 [Alternaria triticimaculans]
MESQTAAQAAKVSTMSFDPSAFLTVRVGPEGSQQDFLLHEGIICKRSELFRRAINGNWPKKKDRIVKLPKDDPKIFALYVNLIYMGVLYNEPDASKMTPVEFQAHTLSTVKFYILAEKLQDKQAKNAALETLHIEVTTDSSDDRLPNAEIVELMYKNTSEVSLGRRLMVDIWTCISTKSILEKSEGLRRDFLVDLAYSLHGERPVRNGNLACRKGYTAYQEKL